MPALVSNQATAGVAAVRAETLPTRLISISSYKPLPGVGVLRFSASIQFRCVCFETLRETERRRAATPALTIVSHIGSSLSLDSFSA